MDNFLFRCPNTGLNVQGRADVQKETPEITDRVYVTQHCPACGSFHPINPRTGKLMSEESRQPPVRR